MKKSTQRERTPLVHKMPIYLFVLLFIAQPILPCIPPENYSSVPFGFFFTSVIISFLLIIAGIVSFKHSTPNPTLKKLSDHSKFSLGLFLLAIYGFGSYPFLNYAALQLQDNGKIEYHIFQDRLTLDYIFHGELKDKALIEYLKTSADKGYARSNLVLSSIYHNGEFGVQPDNQLAKSWLEKTVDQGDIEFRAQAIMKLANIYEADKNYVQARALLKKAAELRAVEGSLDWHGLLLYY